MLWDVFRLLLYLFSINIETNNYILFCYLPATYCNVRQYFGTPRPAQVPLAQRCLCFYSKQWCEAGRHISGWRKFDQAYDGADVVMEMKVQSPGDGPRA